MSFLSSKMTNKNYLVEKVGKVGSLFSTMIATSAKNGSFVPEEEPAIVRKGVGNTINALIAAGVIGSGCGGGDTINNFYGPNGEVISVEAGNCDEYKGKYLWHAQGDFGNIDKVGNGCSIALVNQDHPGFLLNGVISGNKLTVYSGEGLDRADEADLPLRFELLKNGEFSSSDVTLEGFGENANKLINEYMCYFSKDSNLRAMRLNSEIKGLTSSILRVKDRHFPGGEVAHYDFANGSAKECGY
jgi:hypothetical protein